VETTASTRITASERQHAAFAAVRALDLPAAGAAVLVVMVLLHRRNRRG